MRIDKAAVRRALAVLGIVLLLAALLVPAVALARAGGGHVGGSSGGSSFGGSSGGSSFGGSSGGFLGGSSGSSGSGGSIGGCCGTGVIVVIVLIVVVVWIVISMRKGGGGGGGGATYVPPVAGQMPPGDPFSEIKAGDPNFNTEMFYGRVNEMFIAIQYAWMNRNLEPVRRFLSDQQFSVLNNSVQTDYVAKGQINKLDNIHVDHMEPVEVVKQGDYDSVKMLITATVIDYTVDERTGALVNPGELGDGKTPSTFQEFWTFMRKSGVQSKMDATITKCPNCGAPVTDGNYVKCAYCGVQMNDPTLDWVLMRIEQV
jgi:Tim44-like domain